MPRKITAYVIKVIKDDIGGHSSAFLQPSPPTKMTYGMTQRGVGLGSATCYMVVANLRLICRNMVNVYNALLG